MCQMDGGAIHIGPFWRAAAVDCVERLTLRVNGVLVAEVIDNDPLQADASGILALQLHSGPPTFVQFKDIRLKKLHDVRGQP